jgi:hypothetical protein
LNLFNLLPFNLLTFGWRPLWLVQCLPMYKVNKWALRLTTEVSFLTI